MSVLLNNSLIVSRDKLAESINKMRAAFDQIELLLYENESTASEISKTVIESIAKSATATSELTLALKFLRSTSSSHLHNIIISEIKHHKSNVGAYDTDELNACIKESLLKVTELKCKINEIHNKIADLKRRLYPSSLVRWAENVLRFTSNEQFIDLATKGFFSGLFSSHISYARKLQNQKKKIITKTEMYLHSCDSLDYEASPKDIIEQNNAHFSELTSLLDLEKKLTSELVRTEDYEGSMLKKLTEIAHSKRYLNTYDHDNGVKQRLLELVFEHEFSIDELASYCKTYESWCLVEKHRVYEAKKMFLSVKVNSLRIHLGNLNKCLTLIDSLIKGEAEPSTWLKYRSKRILKTFNVHSTIFNDYSKSLTEACIDAVTSTQASNTKTTDSYNCYLDMIQRFTYKDIPVDYLPSALLKSLLCETKSSLSDDDLHQQLEATNEPANTSNAQMVA